MAITNFLFEGSAPPSTTTYGTTTQNLPTWYSDYTQGLINKANAVAAMPYTQNPAYDPNLYGSTPTLDQAQQAQANISAGQSQITGPNAVQNYWQTPFGQAGTTLSNLIGQTAMGTGATGQTAGDYFSQAGQINPFALGAGFLGSGAQSITGAQAPTTQGLGDIQQGINTLGGALGAPSGLDAASPYLQGAAGSTANAYQQYINPYQSQVIDEIQRRGNENIQANVKNITDRFIGGGGFGGSRMGSSLANAIRAGQQDISGQVGNVLSQGYGQALGAAGTDLSRLAQLGSTAGALQQAGIGQQLQGAGQYGTLGGQLAGLQQADLARQLQAGQALGGIGSNIGSLAGQTQSGLSSLGATQAGIAGQDIARQSELANQLQTLGQQGTSLGIQGASALETVGNTQLQQALARAALENKANLGEQEYNWNQINQLNAALRGLQTPTQTQTQATGPASTYQPSPLSQIASAGMTALGIGKLFG